jgi:hypothetical protein
MPIEALLQEFNNPASQIPKYAVLSAMQEAQKQQAMMQAMQGQQAMAQQAQAGPPVAQGVLAGAQQMAAQEQEVPAYNMGGIVAFNPGGPTMGWGGQDYEDSRRFGIDISPYDSAEQRAKKLEMLKAARERERIMQTAFPFGPPEGPMMAIPEVKITDAGPKKKPDAEKTGIATLGTPGYGSLIGGLRTAVGEQNKATLAGVEVSPEEKQIRDAIISQMKEASEAKKTFAEGAAQRAKQDYERRLGIANRPIYEDPESLLALVGGLSTKRGEVFKSLGAGAGALLGGKRKAREEAEKLYGEAQDKLEAVKDAQRNLAITMEQQRLAYVSGDRKDKKAADEKVAQAKVALAEAEMRFAQEDEKIKSDRMRAQAAMRSATVKEAAGAGNIREQQLYLKSLRDQSRSLEEELKGYPRPSPERKAEISAELKQVKAEMSALTKQLGESLGLSTDKVENKTSPAAAQPTIDFNKI